MTGKWDSKHGPQSFRPFRFDILKLFSIHCFHVCSYFKDALFDWQEEAPKPIKRLKLIQRPLEPEIQLNLHNLNSQEALQTLLKFESSLPVSSSGLGPVVQNLLEHYGKEKEALVRGKIAKLLGKLSKVPGISAESLAEELIAFLSKEGNIQFKV